MSGIQTICSTGYAFAAQRVDGSVVSWGHADYGADQAFAALKGDTVVAWGNTDQQTIAVSEPLASLQDKGVVQSIIRNNSAIAALKADGTVVVWGDAQFGGNCSHVQDQLNGDVQSIYHTSSAFAALKVDGSVVT